ncbi:MAG: LuxR C-terminal-related transcriptional regulator [Lutimonas sp.]
MKLIHIALVLSIYFTCKTTFAQELPPLLNYTTTDYNAENQNWAISQTEDHLIYVANNKGLLEFNGARWNLYQSPNQTIIRSVNVLNGLIYTGAYMEFGYWEKDVFGNLNYTSLSKKIKQELIEDEQFWNIIKIDEKKLFFQSLNRIYIYDEPTQTFKIIDSATTITKMYKANNSVYFQELNLGLFQIIDDKKVLVSGDDILRNDVITNIFSFGDQLLILTQNNGFYELLNGRIAEWKNPINSLISNKSIYSGIQLKDKSFLLGTISDGILQTNDKGEVLMVIDQKNGLLNNTVLSVFEDEKNNIWLGLDNGVTCINMKSPFKTYYDNEGILGSVYTSALFKDKIYLGTNQGLYYKDQLSNESFKYIPGTAGQVWSLVVYDDTLFCCHHLGTFIVDDDKVSKIPNTQGSWQLKPLNNKNLILQGNYDGLSVLEKIDNKWQEKNAIKGFNISSRYFEEMPNNEIFINHEYKGIYKIKVDEDFSNVLNITIDSISKGANSSILRYKNELLYAFKNGLYKYSEKEDKFFLDSILGEVYSEDDYSSGKLVTDQTGEILWIFTNSKINYITQDKNTGKSKINSISLNQSLRKGISGYENVLNLGNQNYLFGGISGYLIIDISKLEIQDFEVNINYITKSNYKNSDESSILDPKTNGQLKSHENNLAFSFNVPEYQKYLETNYQYKLEGIYDNWSPWSVEVHEFFENLPYGDYTFKVRAKIGNKLSKNIAVYTFSIEKPWYISNLLLIIYGICISLFFLLVHNLYKRYYRKQRQKIIENNERELKLTQSEQEKEIIRIKNQQLEQENKSKGRELAVSTMSIIKKNELLNTIKDELTIVKDKNLIKPVIKIIDKSLNHDDDWEFFQEAFNNADKDFLQRVKNEYPNLTPNDLRLCAYLRLNLSSKEIAPLLNISYKSVEIKRYRLRKKMELSNEDNLVERILEI